MSPPLGEAEHGDDHEGHQEHHRNTAAAAGQESEQPGRLGGLGSADQELAGCLWQGFVIDVDDQLGIGLSYPGPDVYLACVLGVPGFGPARCQALIDDPVYGPRMRHATGSAAGPGPDTLSRPARTDRGQTRRGRGRRIMSPPDTARIRPGVSAAAPRSAVSPPTGQNMPGRPGSRPPVGQMMPSAARSDQPHARARNAARRKAPANTDRRVRARPKPSRQSRYVIRLPAIVAELCRIVHI